MMPLIVGHRANTDDAKRGRYRPFTDSSSAVTLDKFAPGWRDYPCANLLWSRDDDADPEARAKAIINRKEDTLVLCGRDVAKAFKLSPAVKMFTYYEMRNDKTVVVVPHPSPRNRLWNQKRIQRKMVALFKEMADAHTAAAAA